MSKWRPKYLALLITIIMIASPVWAINGSNLISVGPVSRSMGGVGVAAPQSAISSIFANPAGMCFSPNFPGSEVEFTGSYLVPAAKSTVTNLGGTASEESEMNPFLVPAIGITAPIFSPRWRLGFGAYGYSGLGVDYRGLSSPVYGDLFTKMEIIKIAPNFAYQVNDNFSIGASVSIDSGTIDRGEGGAHQTSFGLQVGAIYQVGMFSLGASYTAPQNVEYERVSTYASGTPLNPIYPKKQYFDLELESPANYAVGIAAQPNDKWLFEFDVKYYPWSESNGYEDFDWDDQWIFAVGAQYRITPKFAVRAGYNYGKNPVKEHDGFDPAAIVNVQGALVPAPLYEQARIVAMPGVTAHHATFGFGWEIAQNFLLNMSVEHAFEHEITESDASNLFSYTTSLEMTSITTGLTWRF